MPAQQRTQVIERATPDSSRFTFGVTNFGGLQQGIESWYNRKQQEAALSKAKQEQASDQYNRMMVKEAAKQKTLDDALLHKRVTAEILQTLRTPGGEDKLAEARETGNWSALGFKYVNDQVASLQNFQYAIPAMIGAHAAQEGWPELQKLIQDADPAENIEAKVDAYTAEATKGMDVVAADAYMAAMEGKIPGQLQDKMAAVATFQNNEIVRDFVARVPENVLDWKNVADFEDAMWNTAGSMTGNATKVFDTIRLAGLKKLHDLSFGLGGVGPNVQGAALKLLHYRAHPDDSTLAEKYEELRVASGARANDPTYRQSTEMYYTVAQAKAMEKAEYELTLADKGLHPEGLNTGQVFNKAHAEMNEFANGTASVAWQRFAQRHAKMKTDGNMTRNVMQKIVTEDGRVRQSEGDKATREAFFSEDPELRRQSLIALGKYGFNHAEIKDHWQRLLGSSDYTEVLKTAREIETLREMGFHSLDHFVPDTKGQIMVDALRNANDVDGQVIVERLRASLKDWDGNPENAFYDALVDSSGSERARMGIAGARDWIKWATDNKEFKEGMARALGMSEGDIADEMTGFSDEVLRRILRTMNIATVAVANRAEGGGDGIEEAIMGPVLRMLRDDVEVDLHNGEPLIVLRKTPRVADGVPIESWTQWKAEVFGTIQQTDYPDAAEAWGVHSDIHTQRDGSKQVFVNTGDTYGALLLTRNAIVGTELANGPLASLVEHQTDYDGMSNLKLYRPGDTTADGRTVTKTMPISPTMYALWTDNAWSIRAVSPGIWSAANAAAVAEQSEKVIAQLRGELAEMPEDMVPTKLMNDLVEGVYSVDELKAIREEVAEHPNANLRETLKAQVGLALQKAQGVAREIATNAGREAARKGQAVEPGVLGYIGLETGLSELAESAEMLETKDQTARELVDEAVSNKEIDPWDAEKVLVPGNPADTLENINRQGTRGGRPIDDVSSPAASPMMNKVVKFIFDREAMVHTAEPDIGKPSQLNIGFGFSLDRSDAREVLEMVGADYDKVRAGEEAITIGQAQAIARAGVAELGSWFRKAFKDTPLSGNQLTALISLAWTSGWGPKPWGGSGPNLITAKLVQAIRSEDWERAAWLIEHDPEVLGKNAQKPHIINGMKKRRALEADMFRGART